MPRGLDNPSVARPRLLIGRVPLAAQPDSFGTQPAAQEATFRLGGGQI
jgi:hypothetical protein